MVQHNAPQAPPPAPVPEYHHGAFGFFRKYQKAILYSAGLFTLVTFSITGALYGLFDNLFRMQLPQPTIVVNGDTFEVTEEDQNIGRLLSQGGFMLGTARMPYVVVLPNLLHDDTRSSDLPVNLAILRRAAVAEGLDVSMAEVDRAIQFGCDKLSEGQPQKTTPTQIAAQVAGSLAQYRLLVKEAMRIGNYVRMQALATDTTDAAVMRSILKDQEVITLRVASLDGKALQDELKKGEVSEEDLRKYLDGKDDGWKRMRGVFDSNHVSLQLGVCELATFDAAQWTEEVKGVDLGDDAQQRLYDEIKDPQFKVDQEQWQKAGKPQPIPVYHSLPDTQEQVVKQLQANAVMTGLLRKIQDQRTEAMKAPNEALGTAAKARNEAQLALDQAKVKAAEKPDDEALKTALVAAEAAFNLKKTELEAAEKALATARETFDFGKAFTDLAKDKAGFAVKEVGGLQNTEQLKTLPDGLGEWKSSAMATAIGQAGELGSGVARTDKVLFLFKTTEVVVNPLKPWTELKDKVTEEYWLEKAQTQTTQKKDAFAKALLDLAKAKIPDKVAEIEGKKQERIDKEFAGYDERLNKRIQDARTILAGQKGKEGSLAWQSWTKALEEATAELGKKDEHKKEIEAKVQKEIEAEVATEARKLYSEVLEAAAQQAGFTLSTIGPYWRELSTLPRFKQRFDDTVFFLFSGKVNKLKVGESTDLTEDPTNRKWLLAVCDKVEPRTEQDVSRREFLDERDYVTRFGSYSFLDERMSAALAQSFSREALEIRYQYKTPGDRENKPVGAASGGAAPGGAAPGGATPAGGALPGGGEKDKPK